MRRLLALIVFFIVVPFVTGQQENNNQLNIKFEKYVLKNGLEVILHEDKSDPLVSVAVQYHVGSNRETKGRTGFAHLFEHMMFQESQHVGQDQFFKKIQNAGGTLNGGTWQDGTIYYQIVPENSLEMVLWLESDRMGFLLSTVTQEAFANQQEVVQNEKRQRVDNQPYGHTSYVIDKLLYPANHPYNWQVIGSLEDLRNASLKDVHDFYKKWYGPDNATLVIAGSFNPQQTKEWVEKYFGEIEKSDGVEAPEPMTVSLSETKRAYYEDNFAKSPELNMVFPTVQQFTDDAYALDFLAQILGDGKKAPLYKVLVEEKKLAPSVSVNQSSQEIAGTFRIRIRTFPQVNLTDAEKAVKEAFERFEKDGFTGKDVERIKAETETGFYNGISSVLGKSFQLAIYNEYAGSPDYIKNDLNKILSVKKEDILRAYNQYIKNKNYVLTSFVPKGSAELAAVNSKLFQIDEEIFSDEKPETKKPEDKLVVEKIAAKFDRNIEPPLGPSPEVKIPVVWEKKLDNNIPVYGIEQNEVPLVQFSITIKGGMLLDDPEKIGVANLITDLMMEGTKNKTPIELEEAIDDLGASLQMYTTKESIVLQGNCLESNLEEVVKIAEEIILEPRWDEKEFNRIKQQTIESINRNKANPSVIASNVFNKIIYGNHILGNSTFGSEESVNYITLNDLKEFYNKNFSPSVSYITVAGSIENDKAEKVFSSLSKKWNPKNVSIHEYPLPQPLKESMVYFVDIPGAKQSEIRVGYLALPYTSPDYYSATVMNYKLGGSFNGIINLILREEKGYTYGARSGFSGTKYPGPFLASTAVQSNATYESVQIIRDEIAKYRKGISAEDLEFTKNALIKSNALRFETLGALLGMLDAIAAYNLPRDYIRQQEEIINTMDRNKHLELAGKYLDPQRMVYLVVGDAQTQLEPLKQLGFGNPVLLDINGNPVIN